MKMEQTEWSEMSAYKIQTPDTYLPINMEQNDPKRRHIKFRLRGITQKKAYTNIFSSSRDLLVTPNLSCSCTGVLISP